MIPVALVMLALAPPPARPPQVEATLGLTSQLMFRVAALDDGNEVHRDYAPITKPLGLLAGVQWYYARGGAFDRGGWRGVAEVGAEPMLPMGSVALSLGFTNLHEFSANKRGIRFALGPHVGAALDVPYFDYSHAEVGLGLGLSTRRVDFLWTPGLSIPLQYRRRNAFGAQFRRGVAVMVIPIRLTLRFKLGRTRR